MGYLDSAQIIRTPGYLVANPTNLAVAGDDGAYGGVVLGDTRAKVLTPLGSPYYVECEGLGEFSDVLESNNRYVFTTFLRGWDRDAIEQCFAGGYSQGSVTGHAVWQEPGTRSPGQSALGRAVVLLFVPEDPVHSDAFILYNAVPDFAEGAEIAFQRATEFGLEVSFECLRDSRGEILAMGRFKDLSLTP